MISKLDVIFRPEVVCSEFVTNLELGTPARTDNVVSVCI